MPVAGASPLFPLLGVDFTRADDVQKFPLGLEVPATDGRVYKYGKALTAKTAKTKEPARKRGWRTCTK